MYANEHTPRDSVLHGPDRPTGKRPGTKVPRRRPPVESIRDLIEPDVRRIRRFYCHGMPKKDIREIYRLSKGQLKAVLRGGPCRLSTTHS